MTKYLESGAGMGIGVCGGHGPKSWLSRWSGPAAQTTVFATALAARL
jgi:hypothetical protein